MTPTAPWHDHRPIWVAGRVLATCKAHYGQPILTTGKPIAIPAGAR